MKKLVSLLLVIIFALLTCSSLSSCTFPMRSPIINGVNLKDFTIVYDFDGLDYNKRAAEYIQAKAEERYALKLKIVDDNSTPGKHEIVVGETSRPISASLEATTEGFEFAILASDGNIALEGDYFIIAAAAYFFMDTYASGDGNEVTVPESVSIYEPIVKEAKNFIMLIGDGMGEYQTRLYEYMNISDVECDYSDGEDIFYGHLFPYMGYSRTESLSGITDSAAGGTALSCGFKTYNEYIGLDKDKNEIENMTELAYRLGKSSAVMSTETMQGATPSTFVVHSDDRDNTAEIIGAYYELMEKYGTIVECSFNYYKASYMEKVIDEKIDETLEAVAENEKGFFLMYEEAHIDKHCHNNDLEKTFLALIRFNQAIARFMEFAFYNPDTFVLITADHETGYLLPDENGILKYNDDYHSEADVPIFAYGVGAELFDGVNIENIQIAHTIAALMGEDNFGDQSEYQSLTK